MAKSVGGKGRTRSARDQERAARLKALDIERTTGRCALCYRIITVLSRKSRYTHRCRA